MEVWGWAELANVMNRACDASTWGQGEDDPEKSVVETWIVQKDDAWVLKLYALLGEAWDSHGERALVDDLCIIRVASNGENLHVKSSEAFFRQQEDTRALPSDVAFVKPSVYASGRSESKKNFAKSFLEHVGVRVYDATADIERVLKQYSAGKTFPLKTHLKHIRQFVHHWMESPHDIEIFDDVAFLMGRESNGEERYFKVTELFLDAPYDEMGLRALFSDNELPVEKFKKSLSDAYGAIKKIREFVVALGVMRQLEICKHKATEMQGAFFRKTGRQTDSTVDEDYFLNGLHWQLRSSDGFIGLFNLKSSKSLALSNAIWRAMCSAGREVLIARYIPNAQRKHQQKSKDSFLVDHLARSTWVPDKDGNFLLPSEVTQEILHPAFKFDDANGWLTAIKFGDTARQKSAEYQDRNQDAENIGFVSLEQAEGYAELAREGITPADIRSVLRIAQRKRPEQPNEAVLNPDRRRKNVLADTADAPTKESVLRERSIHIGVSAVSAQAKAYLRAKYKNHAMQLVCQCCGNEMPFMLPGGEHYFEAVQCIAEKEKRHFKNRLALCPTCAAMYQHARETDDAQLSRRIIEVNAEDQEFAEVPVRLAGREILLRFVATHLFDLKTILSR